MTHRYVAEMDMPSKLPLPLTSPDDLFAKVRRDAALLLDDEVTTDRFLNFVITAYSLIDWVKADPRFASLDRQALHNEQWLKICGDLATASKHFSLDRRQAITSAASSSQGYGVGRYGFGGYGVGEESIQITLNDGTTIDCLELVRGVVAAWSAIFP